MEGRHVGRRAARSGSGASRVALVLMALGAVLAGAGAARAAGSAVADVRVGPLYLPLVLDASPPPALPALEPGLLAPESPPADRPAAEHPDLNLGLRGYAPVDAAARLVDYGGSTDSEAPSLRGLYLYASDGDPRFARVYRVYDWDWAADARGAPIASPEVTLATIALDRWEPVFVPPSGYTVGSGYAVLVLYAEEGRVTLKYTRDDNVVGGYTLHLEGLLVHPELLAAYRAADAAGRTVLPALRAGDVVGLARGGEVGVAIRDAGRFMDPRSRKDWW